MFTKEKKTPVEKLFLTQSVPEAQDTKHLLLPFLVHCWLEVFTRKYKGKEEIEC